MRVLVLLAVSLSSPAFAGPIKAAHGLELKEFAKEPMLRNTVAVCVDEAGHVYATSVVRRKAADLDIRQYREWIETDLSLTSIDQKRAFYRRELVPRNAGTYGKRVRDQNEDGQVDWRDLTVLSDRIIRLTDTDRDGVADEAVTYAEGFNTEVTGIAAGVTAWDGKIYATVEPDLWELQDTDGDRRADRRQSLAHGFSVHIAYAGHNFSGPVVGPDGRLYFSSADKGMNVTSTEGTNFYHPHSGTVARCELDGSHFEVFAYGLRNVQEPAFDRFGNLFGVDNDGDFKGEKERFHYIVEGSDTGWRCNWQYRKDDYEPWIDEGLYIPDAPGRPAYSVPCIRTYRDGPTGFACNPGTALNDHYRDHFFMSAFPARKLYAFQVKPDGPSFVMTNEHLVASNVLMTGINFGPDGALYVADWSAKGYELNEKGGVWTLDDPAAAGSELRRATARLIAADWSKADLAALGSHLGHPDQRVRMKAQFELARRGDIGNFMKILIDAKQPLEARLHAIWGIGQLTRHRESGPWGDPLVLAWAAPHPEIRAQAAKVAGEAPSLRLVSGQLTTLLADPADRPRFFAAIALGRLKVPEAVDPLVAYLAKDGANPFHRHAGMMGLLGCATPQQLATLSTHESTPVRLAAVVALRRLRGAEVSVFLNDKNPAVVAEAAGAIHDDESIPGAMAALAGVLNDPAGRSGRTLRRALSAAQRLRSPAHAKSVAAFAADSSQPEELRLVALELLASWPRPPKLDSVEGRYRPLPPADAAIIAAEVAEPFAALFAASGGKLQEAARAAAATYGIGTDPQELLARVKGNAPDAEAAMRLLADAAP
ncbi:MAG: heme-binding protein, partial [Akkermansiaceae bacterium]|nr:heme-binding protein [Akkermansiaceae bacterium]